VRRTHPCVFGRTHEFNFDHRKHSSKAGALTVALRAVPDHPKFAELMATLNLPKFATLGILEGVWHFTGRYAPQGNVGKYSDQAIESWVGWNGVAGAMVAALIKCCWLDIDATYRLLVHDWDQHADKATKNALKRAKRPFCTPAVRTPSVQSTNESPDLGTASRLPEPEPEPVPEPVPDKKPSRAKKREGTKTKTEVAEARHAEFKAAIHAYWKHKNPELECPWDGSEGAQLGMWLKANPKVEIEQFKNMLRNRARSPDVNHSVRPSKWIRDITDFANGPLDRFNKPLTGGANGKSTAQSKQANTIANVREAVARLRGVDTAGAGEDRGPAGGGSESGASFLDDSGIT
jgi:hypothetical protein